MILELLLEESKKNLDMQKSIKQEIKRLPKGSVKQRVINNRTYYYLAYRKKKKVINEYLGKSALESLYHIQAVNRRKELEKQLKELKKDWQIYNKVGIYENTGEIALVVENCKRGKDFHEAFYEFLKIFYTYTDDKKKMEKLIKKEPRRLKSVSPYVYATCAGAVQWLAKRYELQQPAWIWHNHYYLKEMYIFDNQHPKKRVKNIIQAPDEFKRRNVFVTDDLLNI